MAEVDSLDGQWISLITDPIWTNLEWARHAIRTVAQEDWAPEHKQEFVDLFRALAFETDALKLSDRNKTTYPSKPQAAHYHEAYLDLRVRRAREMLTNVVEIWQ